ncbi:MAG: cation:proton antiporter [Clostridiales bacterium]|nr:cation:proton antiporter [Clostridiales bacterium]
MLGIEFLLDLAIIIVSTKLLGVITKKFHLPQVVGALLAGLFLGPAFLGVIGDSDFIKTLAELGVIIIMFSAGVEVDINELKSAGKAAIIIAILGVTFPLLGGFLVASAFNMSFQPLLQNIFIGVILTATSVSITVETLKEMGKLRGKVGTIILGAAILDDILGIIILTVITGFAGSGSEGTIGSVVLKIIAFFFVALIVGIPFNKMFNNYSRMHKKKRRFPLFAFGFCLFLAYIGEKFFGVADIAGAFIAGLIVSKTVHSSYIHRRFEILSYMMLSPLFFASIGLSIEIESFNLQMLWFTLVLLGVAIMTKIIGGGLGARLSGLNNKESLQVGIGMIARSEVALIVTNKGVSSGILPSSFFAPIAIMVIFTSILTPILLKFSFTDTIKNIKQKKGI